MQIPTHLLSLTLQRPRERGLGALLRLTPCLLLAVLLGCASTDPDKALAQRVDALLAPLVEAHEFSGAVVLTRHGKVVYQRGVGLANHAAGLAFTAQTPSDGASMAKTLTAAGLWWLAHEGRVDLDAPVKRYLVAYPHAQTTVRQLLSHSNGLPADYEAFDPHFKKDEVRSTQAMLAVITQQAQPPSFVPGTRYEYSNLGYDVGALLIEQLSGQRYEDFLQQRFFSRLGMQESFVRPARFADWSGVRTQGYRWRQGAWLPFEVFDLEGFRGGSNIYFSAQDLSRWASAHAAGTALPAEVSASGQRFTQVAGQQTALTGLSWYCEPQRERCYYTGDLNAFYSVAYWDRVRDESVVYVSNSSLPAWRRVSLARGLVDVLAGRPVQQPAPQVIARFDRDKLAHLAGSYRRQGLDPVTLIDSGKGLRLRQGQGIDYELFAVSSEVLYAPGLDFWLAFSGAPATKRLHMKSMFVDLVLQRDAGR